MKYGKRPDICRRAEKENSDSNSVAVKRKKPGKQAKRSSSHTSTKQTTPLPDSACGGGAELQVTGRSVMEEDVRNPGLVLPATLMLAEESRDLVHWLAKDVVTSNPGDSYCALTFYSLRDWCHNFRDPLGGSYWPH